MKFHAKLLMIGGLLLMAAVWSLAGCGGGDDPPERPTVTQKSPQELLRHAGRSTGAQRQRAFQQLASLGPKAAPVVPGLLEFLKHQDVATRRGASQVLGAIGPQAVEPLRALLVRTPLEAELEAAAQALQAMKHEARPAVPELMLLLEDMSPIVQAAAAQALGAAAAPDPDAPAIRPREKAEQSGLAGAARSFLEREAVGQLTSFAEKARETADAGPDYEDYLGSLGINAKAYPDLEGQSSIFTGGRKYRFPEDAHPAQRFAVRALAGQLRWGQQKQVQIGLLRGLAAAGPVAEPAAPMIGAYLEVRDDEVAAAAAEALGAIGTAARPFLPELRHLLARQDGAATRAAQAAIARIENGS